MLEKKSHGRQLAAYSLGLILLLLVPVIKDLQGAPTPPPSAIGDYIEDLLAMQPMSESRAGVSMDIEVIHDAYLFAMAQKYEEYVNYGFDEDLIVSKIKSDHTKYKRYQNRLLFRINISGEGSKHVIFDKKLSSHLEVSQKSSKSKTNLDKRSYHVIKSNPQVRFARWEVYGKSLVYRSTKNLFGFSKLTTNVTSYSIKAQNKEPIYFRLKDIRVQGASTDPKESINVKARQVSTKKGWNALKTHGPTIVMTPGNWQPPLPPTEFLNVLKKVGYK